MRLLAILILVSWSDVGLGQVTVSGRHMVMLSPTIDRVVGSYFFAVDNVGDQPASLRVPVMFPDETEDWVVESGVETNEVHLADSGGVYIEKEFPAGQTMVSMRFQAPVHLGEGQLTFRAPIALGQFVVMVPTGQMSIASDSMELKSDLAFAQNTVDALNAQQVNPGTSHIVKVSGIPEGRGRLWMVGLSVTGVSFLLAMFLAYRSRPTGPDETTGSLLTS